MWFPFLTRVAITTAVTLSVLSTGGCRSAYAADPVVDPDPWLGRDKALHFGISAAIAGSTYAVAATQLEPRYQPLILGGGVALTIGAGKELADMLGLGDPSWKDFAWDAIGTVTGLVVAWGIDLLVRGASAAHPLFGPPHASPHGGTFVSPLVHARGD